MWIMSDSLVKNHYYLQMKKSKDSSTVIAAVLSVFIECLVEADCK